MRLTGWAYEKRNSEKNDGKVGFWTREQVVKMDRKATLQLYAIHPEKMTPEFRQKFEDEKKRVEKEADDAARAIREDRRRKRVDRIMSFIRWKRPEQRIVPNGQRILEEVAERNNVRLQDILCQARNKSVVKVRHEAMYCIARDTHLTFTQIAKLFHRDHTTILHGIRLYADRNGLPRVREERL